MGTDPNDLNLQEELAGEKWLCAQREREWKILEVLLLAEMSVNSLEEAAERSEGAKQVVDRLLETLSVEGGATDE